MSDSDERAGLEEYRQLCEYHRHDDTMKWTILGLGYTAAGALIGLAVSRASSPSIALVAVLLLAAALIVAVTAIYRDIHHDTLKRLVRVHAAEAELGITNHRVFPCPEDPGDNDGMGVNAIVLVLAVVFVGVIAMLAFSTLFLAMLQSVLS